MRDFAEQMSLEDTQLCYQFAINGRRDLPIVPDPRAGAGNDAVQDDGVSAGPYRCRGAGRVNFGSQAPLRNGRNRTRRPREKSLGHR